MTSFSSFRRLKRGGQGRVSMGLELHPQEAEVLLLLLGWKVLRKPAQCIADLKFSTLRPRDKYSPPAQCRLNLFSKSLRTCQDESETMEMLKKERMEVAPKLWL